MHLISHRGNISGRRPDQENSTHYITNALDLGYDVEIDIWYLVGDKKYYLGHDKPDYVVEQWFIENAKDKLWLHCKNPEALEYLKKDFDNINYFWHQEDKYTLTSKGYVWAFPGEKLVKNSIILFPENYPNDKDKLLLSSGICSDYISDYEIYKNIKKIEHNEHEIILKLKNPVYNFFNHSFNVIPGSSPYSVEPELANKKEYQAWFNGAWDRLLPVVTELENNYNYRNSYNFIFNDDLTEIENVFIYPFTPRYYHNLTEVFPKLIKLKEMNLDFTFVLCSWEEKSKLDYTSNLQRTEFNKSNDYYNYLIEFLNLLNIKYKFIDKKNFNKIIFKNSYIFYEKKSIEYTVGHNCPHDFLEKNWDKSLSIYDYNHSQLFYEIYPKIILERLKYIRNYLNNNLNLKENNYPKKIFISRKHFSIRKDEKIVDIKNSVKEEAVEKFFKENGYHIVNMENFGFLEQLKLSNNAEIIACFVGSSALNAFYSHKNIKILFLNPINKEFNNEPHLKEYYNYVLSISNVEHISYDIDMNSENFVELENIIKNL